MVTDVLRPWLRDVAAEALFSTGLTRPGRALSDRLSIVTFHRVLPRAELDRYPLPGLAVTPEELGWFLDFFAEHFTCGSLAETLARWGRATEGPLLAITFDDGQLDNFLHARPVLARRSTTATFFVPLVALGATELLWHDRIAYAVRALGTSAARGSRELLDRASGQASLDDLRSLPALVVERAKTWSEVERDDWLSRAIDLVGDPTPDWDGFMDAGDLAKLAAEGHEIGCHSATHALLPRCSDAALHREVAGSKERLEALLKRPIGAFCYPNGEHDERVVAATRAAGYSCAVTTRWGSNATGADPFRLRRCDVNAEHARSAAGRLSESRLAWRMSGLHPGLREHGLSGRRV